MESPTTYLMLDCESSSLDPERSWPVELGWLAVDARTGFALSQVEAFLVRPSRQWMDWSPASQAIHGICWRDAVKNGLDHVESLRRLTDAARNRPILVTSGWDRFWITRLVESVRGKSLPGQDLLDEAGLDIRDFRTEMRSHLSRHGAAASAITDERIDGFMRAAAAISPPRHRAGPDAMHLAVAWSLAVQSLGLGC